MESYLEIIHKLQKFGNVLTEHIGDKNRSNGKFGGLIC